MVPKKYIRVHSNMWEHPLPPASQKSVMQNASILPLHACSITNICICPVLLLNHHLWPFGCRWSSRFPGQRERQLHPTFWLLHPPWQHWQCLVSNHTIFASILMAAFQPAHLLYYFAVLLFTCFCAPKAGRRCFSMSFFFYTYSLGCFCAGCSFSFQTSILQLQTS